ncbi:MAG: Ycf48-like protein [Phycisphaerae bacterium]|nr:Ycf48-like protein [Phycisphaerae bacterium]
MRSGNRWGRTTGLMLGLAATGARADWVQTAGPEVALLEGIAARGDLVLAGGAGGLFRSEDGGQTWMATTQGLPPNTRISEFAFIGGRILASGPFAGLFQSEDDGLTWTRLVGRLPNDTVVQFHVDGADVYAVNNRSLWVSANRGDSWTEIPVPDSPAAFTIHEGVFFIGSGNGLGVLRSFNRGENWEFADDGLPFDLYEQFTATDTALFVAGRSGVFRTTDSGDAWIDAGSGITGGPRPVSILAQGSVLYLAGGNPDHVHRSFDDGRTWEPASSGVPRGARLRPSGLAVDADRLLLATNQGVYRSTDGGDAWGVSNRGMIGATMRALSGAGKTLLGAAAVAHPVFRSKDGGETWKTGDEGLPSGDNDLPQYFSVAAFKRGEALIGTDRYGMFVSADSGRTWSPDNAGYPQYNGTAGNQFREAEAIARNNEHIFVGTGYGTEFFNGRFNISGGGVWRRAEGGGTWTGVNNGFPIIARNLFNEPVYAPVNAMYADRNVVLVSTFTRGVFRSTNDGGSWAASNDGLPRDTNGFLPEFGGFVKVEGDLLGAAMSFAFGSGGEGVFRSRDRGLSWARSDSGIPAGRSVLSIVEHEGGIYAAVWSSREPLAQNGVYVSEDGGFNWTRTDGLDGVILNDLASNRRGLFIGTRAAGVWRYAGK